MKDEPDGEFMEDIYKAKKEDLKGEEEEQEQEKPYPKVFSADANTGGQHILEIGEEARKENLISSHEKARKAIDALNIPLSKSGMEEKGGFLT